MNIDTKKLILKAQKQVYSERLGNHKSKFHGEGFEFSELREYSYGDDIRKIDWNTTAKRAKPYVKIYNEERELNVVVATMFAGSAYFGTFRQKSDVMREVVALLGFSALSQNDRLSLYLFADKLISFSKPSKQKYFLVKELEFMENFNMLGRQANYNLMIDTLYKNVSKKSIIYLVSDGICDIELGKLSKKHEVVLIIIRDRFEENPKELGMVKLIDMETNVSFFGKANKTIWDKYKEALYINDKKLYEDARKYEIKIVKIYTDENVYLKLLQGV